MVLNVSRRQQTLDCPAPPPVQYPSLMTPLFREGGLYKIRRTGRELYEMSIPFPSDADGRTARECPSSDCSPGYFKVKSGTGITENHTAAYCPYCRFTTHPEKFVTKRQVEYAKAVMKREAFDGMQDAVKDALGIGASGKRTLVDGLIKVELSLESSSPPPVRKPFGQVLQRAIVCPHCGLDHAVFGLATWCPDCGVDIFLTHVDAELDVVRSMLRDTPRRSEQLGKRIVARDVENCLEDVVSIYEAVLRAILVRRLRDTGKTSDEIHDILKQHVRNKLQNVRLSQEVIQELFAVNIFEALSPPQIEALRRTFEKRHPITHNLGVVDKKYLERLRTAEREGREVLVNADEVSEVVGIVVALVTRLHQRVFSPSV
jgi:hypothetical protein